MTDPTTTDLTAAEREHLYAAARAIRDRHPDAVQRELRAVLKRHPHHAEALRLRSIFELQSGLPQRALATLATALRHAPDDAQLLGQTGNVHSACGDVTAALAAWRSAVARDADLAPAWYNIGRALQTQGDSAAADAALTRARALLPDFVPAAVLHGDALTYLGQFAAAAAEYRAALALQPDCGDAWRGLANIKTVPLEAADAALLTRQLARGDLVPTDRVLMELTLGKLEEDRGNLAAALAAFQRGNDLQARLTPWSGAALRAFVDAALAATTRLPPAPDPQLGHEVIFIVGMPRSGSTLVEQILAAHPQVAGASELPDLSVVIAEESRRRGQRYPDWIPRASAADWQRLGREYLARTARWRSARLRHTDKLPENWHHVGVLRAMLPAATIIETRRDPLETAWSCYKQAFYGQPHFANRFADVATALGECTRAMDAWRLRDVQHIHRFDYATLLAAPDATIRQLLADCGLSFAPECRDFHLATRSVRTASAAQVRQPLHAAAGRAAAYGPMLQPLRDALRAAGIDEDRVGSRNLPAPSHTTVRAVPHTAVHE